MIESPAAFVALLLLLAGVFPAVAARYPARVFEVLPPIVLSYAASTALAMAGCWRSTTEIDAVRSAILTHLLPALVFLLLVRCDLRAVVALGLRVLLAAFCSTISILLGIVVAWILWRSWLPADGWRVLASIGATWIGGTANLVAVSRAINAEPDVVSLALLTDTICYTAWVLLLFASVPFARRFNQWAGATQADNVSGHAHPVPATGRLVPGDVLVWLAISLLVGTLAAAAAQRMPPVASFTPTSWTLILATVAGCAAALTPLARLPGSDSVASALLAVVIVAMASQANVAGLGRAPVFVAAGFTVLAFHTAAMVAAAKLLRLDLGLCSVASLANVGGVGSAPILAAAHSRALVPVGILLGLLGYVIGTAAGLGLAALLPALGSGGR
jgi:uncharacterized membrane protein